MLIGLLGAELTRPSLFVCLFVSNPADEETAAAFDFQSCFQTLGGSGT